MRDSISYDELYKKLSAPLVIYEHEVFRSGKYVDSKDDRRVPYTSTPAFIGYGEQLANPRHRMVSLPTSIRK